MGLTAGASGRGREGGLLRRARRDAPAAGGWASASRPGGSIGPTPGERPVPPVCREGDKEEPLRHPGHAGQSPASAVGSLRRAAAEIAEPGVIENAQELGVQVGSGVGLFEAHLDGVHHLGQVGVEGGQAIVEQLGGDLSQVDPVMG